jgi:hypothetical protein
MASRGSNVSNKPACRGRSLCPLRRPKNARAYWNAEPIGAVTALGAAIHVVSRACRYSKVDGGWHDAGGANARFTASRA